VIFDRGGVVGFGEFVGHGVRQVIKKVRQAQQGKGLSSDDSALQL
jgi:hypothetical protein